VADFDLLQWHSCKIPLFGLARANEHIRAAYGDNYKADAYTLVRDLISVDCVNAQYLVKCLDLEELPEFLTHVNLDVRKIAAKREAYLRRVERWRFWCLKDKVLRLLARVSKRTLYGWSRESENE